MATIMQEDMTVWAEKIRILIHLDVSICKVQPYLRYSFQIMSIKQR
jgi:hypothetical protein